jgi:hypothetical protein
MSDAHWSNVYTNFRENPPNDSGFQTYGETDTTGCMWGGGGSYHNHHAKNVIKQRWRLEAFHVKRAEVFVL